MPWSSGVLAEYLEEVRDEYDRPELGQSEVRSPD